MDSGRNPHTREYGRQNFEVILVELKDGSGEGTIPAAADDPVKVDPKHLKVVFENDRVRVLRGIIAPHTKTKMHAHPGNVVIFLTDASVRSSLADGKIEQVQAKAGQVSWRDYVKNDAENLSDRPLDVIVVELKSKQ